MLQWRQFPHVAIEAEKRAGPIDRFPSRLSLAAAAVAFDHRPSTVNAVLHACANSSHRFSSTSSSPHGYTPLRLTILTVRDITDFPLVNYMYGGTLHPPHPSSKPFRYVQLFSIYLLLPSVRRVIYVHTHTHTCHRS